MCVSYEDLVFGFEVRNITLLPIWCMNTATPGQARPQRIGDNTVPARRCLGENLRWGVLLREHVFMVPVKTLRFIPFFQRTIISFPS
jgi:hypothetical protein